MPTEQKSYRSRRNARGSRSSLVTEVGPSKPVATSRTPPSYFVRSVQNRPYAPKVGVFYPQPDPRESHRKASQASSRWLGNGQIRQKSPSSYCSLRKARNDRHLYPNKTYDNRHDDQSDQAACHYVGAYPFTARIIQLLPSMAAFVVYIDSANTQELCIRAVKGYSESAVEALLNRTEFLLYHRLATADELVPLNLPLVVAYKTSLGEFRHYPIIGANNRYKVQCGDVRAPSFPSLATLVRYYEYYGHVQLRAYTTVVDVFPWWLDHQQPVVVSPPDAALASDDDQTPPKLHPLV